jgi:FixJ family two-component response regulator
MMRVFNQLTAREEEIITQMAKDQEKKDLAGDV